MARDKSDNHSHCKNETLSDVSACNKHRSNEKKRTDADRHKGNCSGDALQLFLKGTENILLALGQSGYFAEFSVHTGGKNNRFSSSGSDIGSGKN